MADQGTEAHRLEENHPKVLLINVEVLRVASVPVESDLLLIKNRIFDQTVSNLTRSSVENSHFGMNDLALSPKWKESRVVAEVQLHHNMMLSSVDRHVASGSASSSTSTKT